MSDWRTKKVKNNINVYQKHEGPNRSSELMAESDTNSNYFPKAIEIIDIDKEFFNLVKEGQLKLVIDGEEVPTFIMNGEKWAEFTQTYKIFDDDKNIAPPFLTIKREKILQGTYLDVKYSVPNKKKFEYCRVKTFKNGVIGYDIYNISQPSAIDILYNISFFSTYMEDLNKFYEKYISSYSDRQLYINVNGHFFPTTIDDEGLDDDTTDDIDDNKLFIKSFIIRVQGYLQNDEDFEIIEALNRVFIATELNGVNTGTDDIKGE